MTYRTTFYAWDGNTYDVPSPEKMRDYNAGTKEDEHYLAMALFEIAHHRTWQGGDIHSTYLEMYTELFQMILDRVHRGEIIGLIVGNMVYDHYYVIFNTLTYPDGIVGEKIQWLKYGWTI